MSFSSLCVNGGVPAIAKVDLDHLAGVVLVSLLPCNECYSPLPVL